MELGLLVRGMTIGLAISAPVGPIGVLCIRRTLVDGRASGFASGLGAASADLVYGLVAVFGLTAAADVLAGASFWGRLIGGLFLCYLGLRTLRSAPAEGPAAAGARGLLGAYASTFALTITNPATLIAFAAVFASLGASSGAAGYADALLLAVGVFVGSALWWLLLSGGVSLMRGKVTSAGLRWVNRAAGLIIIAFGAVALASLLL